jgi:hypothetical protein
MRLPSSNVARYCALLVISLSLTATANAQQKPSGDPVKVADDGTAYTLSNGIIDARVEKKSGDLISLKYKGTEMTAMLPGQPAGREYAYCSRGSSMTT